MIVLSLAVFQLVVGGEAEIETLHLRLLQSLAIRETVVCIRIGTLLRLE